MSAVGKVLLITVKSHLDLYSDLKSNLPPEELHPEGSDIDEVPGADSLLINFNNLYKENPTIRNYLSFCLLCGIVANMSGNINPTLILKAYNFFSVSAAHPRSPLKLLLGICWVRLCAVFKIWKLNVVKKNPSLTEAVKK